MAALELRNKTYRVVFMHAGKKYAYSLDTGDREMATFRACWDWGVHGGKLRGPFPGRGLKYPKGEEKPPFQTWEEIERRVALGGLTGREQEELWDCLFLTLPEVGELLAFVKANAAHPWIYPAFCLAAHTGGRRSEVLRVKTFCGTASSRTVPRRASTSG
jgi:integrase